VQGTGRADGRLDKEMIKIMKDFYGEDTCECLEAEDASLGGQYLKNVIVMNHARVSLYPS
jgi:hypothetical protein